METIIDPIPWEEPSRNTASDIDQRIRLSKLIECSSLTGVEIVKQFPKFVQTKYLRKFLSRFELYKLILNSHGCIIECGSLGADGLFSFAHFVEIFEPFNHLRRLIGFDTFEGFPSISDSDKSLDGKKDSEFLHVGGLRSDTYEEIIELKKIFEESRPLKHLERIELVKGDAAITIPRYLESHKELIVSLLWLDFDIYEPTKIALRNFLPRMSKGSIIAFDELNHPLWPGETIAMLEELEIQNYQISRFPFGSTVCYIQI